MKFKKGNKAGIGGARPNSGPKPSWWKQEISKMLKTSDGIEMLKKGIKGEYVDIHIDKDGDERSIPPRWKDRADIFLKAAEHVEGKPIQAVEHSGDLGVNIIDLIKQAEQERGIND